MNQNATKKVRTSKSRLKMALVIILALVAAAWIFLKSDIPFLKSGRDALFEKLGYVSEESLEEGGRSRSGKPVSDSITDSIAGIDADKLPEFSGKNYISVNNSVPEFPDDVYDRASLKKEGGSSGMTPYEYYGSLDNLGRCTYAYGCLGDETMPQNGEERGDISSVHPSGWAKAQNWERCHLIAWALGAENANPSNLITGTHYLNYDGMRPLEEEVEHYIWSSGNHVLYMVKPWFYGDELVARGVQMMAKSVEDDGKGISFNVYCFNVTPGADIDYRTGIVTTEEQAKQEARLYVINKRSGVFHYPSCEGAQSIFEHNREERTATRTELTSEGYTPCGYCEP